MPRRKRKLSPEQRLLIEDRRREVMRLLREGYSYRQISERLLLDEWFLKAGAGISPATVASDVKVILAQYRKESVQDCRDRITLIEMRLNAALVAIWPDVEAGDCKAIETMLKIEERRAKLLGLDSWVNLLDDADLEQMSDEDLTRVINGKPPLSLAS